MYDGDSLNGRFALRVLAAMGTLSFALLLTHTSESGIVFGRYSVQYVILLTLVGANVLLLWVRSVSTSLPPLSEQLKWQQLVPRTLCLALTLLSALFLYNLLFSPRGVAPADWAIVALFAVLLLQIDIAKRRSSFLRRTAVIGTSFVFSVFAAEGLFRFLVQNVTPTSEREFLQLMRNPDYQGWTPWPEPIAREKPLGTYRFIGLADSFGIWGGAQSNYFRLLEQRLQATRSTPVQLVNLSIDGYEPRHQLRMLRFGMAYAPDLVVHGFFIGNDFTLDDYRIYKFLGIRGHQDLSAPRVPRQFLLRGWIEFAWHLSGELREIEREQRSGATSGTLSGRTFRLMQYHRFRNWGERGDATIARLQSVFPVLDDIRRVAEAGGARYVLTIHPDQTQVDEALRRELAVSFGIRDEAFDLDLPQRVLKEYCATRQVACVDLLPIVRAHGGGNLYLYHDTHYNEAGRQLVAQTIGDFLASLGGGPQ